MAVYERNGAGRPGVSRGTALTNRQGTTEIPSMKCIQRYSMQFEADLGRIALEGAGIPAAVVGVGLSMDGGMGGVQLLVPEERVSAALEVLKDLEGSGPQAPGTDD